MSRRTRVVLWLGFCLLGASPRGVAGDDVSELNGWRLQQFHIIVSTELGEPFAERENSAARAYRLGKDAYMVFRQDPVSFNNIGSIQLTGTSADALPFKGLSLGDPQQLVLERLGKPSEQTDVPEAGTTRWSYEGKNYSVEVDRQGRLYSILIYSSQAFLSADESPEECWSVFRDAILSGDRDRLLSVLRPDVEIYRQKQTLDIRRRYADFSESPDPEFLAAFFSPATGVAGQLVRHTPDMEVRTMEKLGMGLVYKFPKESLLREIVMLPYDGRFRVYEVAFRELNGGKY